VYQNGGMRYETLQEYEASAFKRFTGVRRPTFEVLLQAVIEQTRVFGRPPKLSLADQLLLTLLYWREYRTLFHLGADFGVSEATASRIVKKIEKALLKSKKFTLPGKKALQEGGTVFEVVLVDATESPVERPKKDSGGTSVERRNDTPRRLS